MSRESAPAFSTISTATGATASAAPASSSSSAAPVWTALSEGGEQAALLWPYLLKLLTDQVASTGTVPTGRAGLFTGFVRECLRREIERDNPLFLPNSIFTERDCRRIVHTRRWREPYELPENGPLFRKMAELAYAMQLRRASGEVVQVRLP